MTVVFVDMQGYTKRSAQQTIDEMKLFHDQMFKFVSDIMLKWNGIMVKTMGDGFMVRFDSPTNAVQSGIELQRRLEARNAQMMNPESIVRFRIGINTGEVGIDENGDLFGDPVNIAARIQTFADTNDVFISEATFLAMNRNEFGSIDLGHQDLKNATREIKIYKVLKNGAPGVTLSAPQNAKSAGRNTVGQASEHKKYVVGLAIAGLVVLTLIAGYYIGRKSPKKALKKVAAQEEAMKPPPAENVEDKNKDESAKTLLSADPDSRALPFDDRERKILGEVQAMRNVGDYATAEKVSADMVYRVSDNKKVLWALILAELFWEQDKKDNAGKIFTNIARSELLQPTMKKKALEQIEIIKKL